MELENKPFYSWLPWFVSILITALFLVLFHKESVRQENEWQDHLRLQQATATAVGEATKRRLLRQATSMAEMIAQDPVVVALIRQAALIDAQENNENKKDTLEKNTIEKDVIRKQLLSVLSRYWVQMLPLGGRELNVHLSVKPKVFLRVNDVQKFGDNVIQTSTLLTSVIKTTTAVHGIEISHYGANFRAMVPIFSKDNPDSDVVAVIEAGFTLLPQYILRLHQGHAVLIDSTLASNLSIGASTSTSNIDASNNPWYVESSSSVLIKEWQKKGYLTQSLLLNDVPRIIHEQQKSYLLNVMSLTDFLWVQTALSTVNPSASNTTISTTPEPTSAKILLLTWIDITEKQAIFSKHVHAVILNYFLGWFFALTVLWILFYFNSRYVLQLLRAHGKQLQQERDLSEQSRQRLNLALVSSESGFWEWNITTNRAFFSKEWRELCGLPAHDGNTDIEEWLALVHPNDKRLSYSEMIRHIKGETAMFENEYRLKIADGSYKWILTRGRVVEWLPDGKAALMLGVYSDITVRKKNEIIVMRQQEALRSLTEITSTPTFDPEEQLRRALIIGARYLSLSKGTISVIRGNQYQIKVSVGQPNARNLIGPLSNYFCELALNAKDVFCCDEINTSEYASHYAVRHAKIDSYIGIPIWVKNATYGSLSFDSDYSRHQHYDELDKDFMRLLARWVGVTLERWEYQTEQQLHYERFEKLCQHLPGFLYQFQVNPDGSSFFPFASSGIDDIYSVSPEDVQVNANAVFTVIHNNDLDWISESIAASANSLHDWIATFRIVHPRRGEIWVHGEARPERLDNGGTLWHGYIQDVTTEKLAALKLQDINALREAIFDAASISIISTDLNGIIKTFNQGAEQLLGYSATEVIDKLTPELFHLSEEVAARAKLLSKKFLLDIKPSFDVFTKNPHDSKVDESEWTYVRKDGTHVPVILSISALHDSDGKITGYLGLARDISEIKRIDRMKNEFISTVSHELRTPLTAISGPLSLMINGVLGEIPEAATKMLRIAHNNSLRLIHIVNDLLDMEKLSAGKMNFDLILQPITPLLIQSLENNAAYATQYGVKFIFNNQLINNELINIDSQRIQQVLANFLSNAAKFSPSGEVIELRSESILDGVRISVIDKGPGISEEFRGRIFQKFSQADASDSREKGGAGLGLAICKEIIEHMNGRIGFLSDGIQGSQFYVEIPTKKILVGDEIYTAPKLTDKKLLIVGDKVECAELLAVGLRAQSYGIDIVYSNQVALEYVAINTYQTLIIDNDLFNINGSEIITQFRRDIKSLPVIVIASNAITEQASCSSSPIFVNVQWLQKPQSMDAIIAAVSAALND